MSDNDPGEAHVAYEEWPYEKLRDAAFERARHRRDVQFFLDLMEHTPALNATADEGGSLGEISGSLIETFEAARDAFSHSPSDEVRPLFVAVFATYLRDHEPS